MTVALIVLALVSIAAISSTVLVTARDGYRRVPATQR